MYRFRESSYIETVISALPLTEVEFLFDRDSHLVIGDKLRTLIYIIRAYFKCGVAFNYNHKWYRSTASSSSDNIIINPTIFRQLASLPINIIPKVNYYRWMQSLQSDNSILEEEMKVKYIEFCDKNMVNCDNNDVSNMVNDLTSVMIGMLKDAPDNPELNRFVSGLSPIMSILSFSMGMPYEEDMAVNMGMDLMGSLGGLMPFLSHAFEQSNTESNIEELQEPDLDIEIDIGADQTNNIDLGDLGIELNTDHVGIGEFDLNDLPEFDD